MTWINEFISRALEGLPKDKYRSRSKAELEDHLLSLTQDLEDAGESPAIAQARALELMGDPVELNRSFREEWVCRASNWRYGLKQILKSSLHAILVNIFIRWCFIMPVFMVASDTLYHWVEMSILLPAFIFAVVNFLPGLWFSARELNEAFFIYPRHRFLLLCSFLITWLLDFSPYWSDLLFPPVSYFAAIPATMIFLGQSPLMMLYWSSAPAFRCYLVLTLVLCLLFGLLYHPRNNKPFILSDTK